AGGLCPAPHTPSGSRRRARRRRRRRRPVQRPARGVLLTPRPTAPSASTVRRRTLRPRLPTAGDRLHDLRDTGLTHMAVRGDSPILIQWAGGHTDFKTTQGYIARGQTERRRIGEPLPPLPPGLLPKGGEVSAEVSAKPNPQTEIPKPSHYLVVTPMGLEPMLPT